MSNGPVCRHSSGKTGHGTVTTGHGPGPENEVDTVPVRFRDMVFVKNKHKMYMFFLKKKVKRTSCVCNIVITMMYVIYYFIICIQHYRNYNQMRSPFLI